MNKKAQLPNAYHHRQLHGGRKTNTTIAKHAQIYGEINPQIRELQRMSSNYAAWLLAVGPLNARQDRIRHRLNQEYYYEMGLLRDKKEEIVEYREAPIIRFEDSEAPIPTRVRQYFDPPGGFFTNGVPRHPDDILHE